MIRESTTFFSWAKHRSFIFRRSFWRELQKEHLPNWVFFAQLIDELSPVLQKLFSLCFVFDSSDALHQKDCLTQSHGIHGYTHGSVDRQHQSSRFMDVAFVAMRIWHFHRNKAHRPPEEPLISGVFFGVLWCVGRRICECFWNGWLQMDIGFMMNYDKCI